MNGTDGRAGVMLVRIWMHDGRLVARVHTWTTAEEDQSTDVVVGSATVSARMLAWLAAFEEASV